MQTSSKYSRLLRYQIPMKLKTGTNLEYENGIHFSLAYASRAFTPVGFKSAFTFKIRRYTFVCGTL